MNVLVANLGTTSFKFKVLDSAANYAEVARGSYERVGQPTGEFQTHAQIIDVIANQLPVRPDAIGFKAVHGGPISGAVRVDDDVLEMMEQFADVAPAHNPIYISAMRSFREKLPDVPQVAAFETAFHATIPDEPARSTRSRGSGPPSSASDATDFTARRTATSRAGCAKLVPNARRDHHLPPRRQFKRDGDARRQERRDTAWA